MNTTRSSLARFVLDNSLLLLAGTGAALVWANLDFRSYDRVAHPFVGGHVVDEMERMELERERLDARRFRLGREVAP